MLMLLIVIGTSIWVYADASNMGIKKLQDGKGLTNMGPVGWLICCLLLWIIAFPLYLIKRPAFKKQFQPSTVAMPPSKVPVAAVVQSQDAFDRQLRQLAKLKEDGIISAEEFDQKKKAILGI